MSYKRVESFLAKKKFDRSRLFSLRLISLKDIFCWPKNVLMLMLTFGEAGFLLSLKSKPDKNKSKHHAVAAAAAATEIQKQSLS